MRLPFGGLLLAACLPFAAHAQSADPLAWLQRAAAAAHQLNYTGTFVYQHDNQVETSRITHRVDESGEQEKLEALDGPPRTIIRNNDEVLCYLHGNKTVKLEKRETRKLFPDLLPKQLAGLTDSYHARLGEQERVAAHDSQVILLEPKDGFRYGHKLWADMQTGLLLKAGMFNEKNQPVDQFTFTQITIGGQVAKELFKPRPLARGATQPERMALADRTPTDSGWVAAQVPPGFKKILELKRSMPGRKEPVSHLVYSDGLVAVSLFIEPAGDGASQAEGLSTQGAINVYIRQLGDYRVTALGEVPAVTVMQIANSLASKTPK